MGDGVDDLGRKSQKAGAEIDKLSGRMRIFADIAVTLGPALAPLGAVGVAGVAGLAQQFGFAALAGGTMVAAFQGVGDALKAMNKAGLEPTAANIQAAQIAMEQISPAAQDFVVQLREMTPQLKELRDTAAAGLFPGMTEGLDALLTRMPDVQRIIGAVSGELGNIAGASGKSLASARWDDFFEFLRAEAPKALSDMASATGNVTHALAELWMAFGPLNSDFSTWMVDATKGLDEWATGLSKTQGFADFIDYVRTNGPQVADTMGALGNAVLQIVEAAAPLGGPVLKGLEAVANVLAAVADSDLGTPIFTALSALALYNRALQLTGTLSQKAFGGAAVSASVGKQRTAIRGMIADYQGVAVAQRKQVVAQQEYAQATEKYNRQLQTLNTMQSRPELFGTPSGRQFSRVEDSLDRVQKTGRAQALAAKQVAEAEKAKSAAMREGAAAAGKTAALMAGLTIATTGLGESMGVTNTASLGLAGSMAGPVGAAVGVGIGAIIDLTARFKDLDDAMTNSRVSARSGDIRQMAQDYRDLEKAMGEASKRKPQDFLPPVSAVGIANSVIKKVKGDKFDDAQTNLGGAINGAAAASAGIGLAQLAKGFQTTAAGARSAAQSVKEFRDSVIAANEAITGQGAFDSYRASLIDAREQVEKTGRSLKANGDIIKDQGRDMKRTGLESRQSLRTLASGAIEFAGSMKNAERRTKFLDSARGDFIALARSMGVGRAAASRLADGFGLTDKGAKTAAGRVSELRSQINRLKSKIVDAKEKGAKESSPRVQALRAEIARLKSKTVQVQENGAAASRGRVNALVASIAAVRSKSVTIETIVRRRQGGGTGLAVAQADGGTVPGERYPYADKVHAYLAPGEYVVSNRYGQADRHRDLLRRINANALADGGTVQRLANGGTARRRRSSGGRSRGTASQRAALARFRDALEDSTKAVNKEKDARSALNDKRASLASSVAGSFTSDIFAGGNVWQAGGGDPTGMLKADIAKANAFKATLAALRKQGLDGDALAAIASTGDIGKAQALAAQGKAGVGQYESLFNQRAAAANSVGSYAGAAAYRSQQIVEARQYAALIRENRALRASMNRVETAIKHVGRDTGHHINKAAGTAGRRRGRG